MKIGPKLSLITISLITVLVVAISFVNSYKTINFVEETFIDQAKKNLTIIDYQIDLYKKNAETFVRSVASKSAMKAAMKSKDRVAIMEVVNSALTASDVEYVNVAFPNFQVVYRSHEPNNYGDYVPNNPDYKIALTGKVVSGLFTAKVIPLAVRSASPIYDENHNLIGLISAGYRADNQKILDKYKAMYHADFTFYKGDTRISTTVTKDGKRVTGTKVSEKVGNVVLKEGIDYTGVADVVGVPNIVYYQPMKGHDGKTIGMIFCGIPLSMAQKQEREILTSGIITAVFFLLIIAFVIYFILKKLVVKPINIAVEMSNNISKGVFNETNVTSKDEFGELAESFNAMQTTIKEVINENNQMAHEAVSGNFKYRADALKFQGEYKTMVEGTNSIVESYVVPLQIMSDYLNQIDKGDLPEKILDTRPGDFVAIRDAVNHLIDTLAAMRADGALLIKGVQDGIIQDVRADATKHKGIYYEIIQGFNQTLDTIADPIVELFNVLEKLSSGDLSARMIAEYTGTFELLKDNLNNTINSLPLEEITQVMAAMADGDLTVNMIKEYKGDNLKIKNSVNETLESLNQILGNVKSTVDEVTRASMQVSDTSSALSQGATQQAASLEEITSSMHEIGSQTRRNAENANVANTLSTNARDAAERGNSEMGQLTSAMTEINTSSNNISKIIKVIDDIAFQTNLLALNAAVEAARAGRHGKGFAVVAEEVRSLAARSAKAAQETSEMIENSIKTVDRGAELVQKTGEALMGIQQEAVKVADIIAEINTSSNEQAQGIAQINEGLSQIDRVTQTNTASAEESASAAEELSGQASQLRELVDRFRLTNNGGGGSYSMRLNSGRNRSLNRYNA